MSITYTRCFHSLKRTSRLPMQKRALPRAPTTPFRSACSPGSPRPPFERERRSTQTAPTELDSSSTVVAAADRDGRNLYVRPWAPASWRWRSRGNTRFDMSVLPLRLASGPFHHSSVLPARASWAPTLRCCSNSK
jgi:hypothetical protein